MNRLKISAIIPTRNRVPYLKQLLDNINNQRRLPDEVVIVGHNADSLTRKFLENLDKNMFRFKLKYVFVDGGTSKSRNVGASISEGEVLVFLDDDVILPSDYIENVEKIFAENPHISIVTGYTFDIVDLVTPWIAKKGDILYLWENRNSEFTKLVFAEIQRRCPEKSITILQRNMLRLYLWHFLKCLRNAFKTIFMWEFPVYGKILPSGYRSEFPEIQKIQENGGLIEVEWIQGNNFAARRKVFEEFRFNEELEKIHSYALNEDLEWATRVSKKYKIYLTSEAKLIHLRALTRNRIDYATRLKALVISTKYIARIKGNKMAHLWATFGLLVSRIPTLFTKPREGARQIKAIIEGLAGIHGDVYENYNKSR
ncbi:glycosyltransferase family A protein [Thermococcus sp. M39]|uniref:glycosyltransferase family A protein n=1 Tax=Thermococcus sp. M39 TaxID=1638262 RepID=UPI00143A4597|nr:glycosyltransferase family 2 protein [Thermococcus sp. M39]